MSSEKVNVKELSNAIMDYLNNYSEDIHDEVVEVTEDVTKKAILELKETSPRGKGSRSKPYHLGWESKIKIKGKFKYHRVIWNKTNYQLTHLLEFGHHKRNGKKPDVQPQPHIQPIEDKYQTEFIDLLSKRIRGKN